MFKQFPRNYNPLLKILCDYFFSQYIGIEYLNGLLRKYKSEYKKNIILKVTNSLSKFENNLMNSKKEK